MKIEMNVSVFRYGREENSFVVFFLWWLERSQSKKNFFLFILLKNVFSNAENEFVF